VGGLKRLGHVVWFTILSHVVPLKLICTLRQLPDERSANGDSHSNLLLQSQGESGMIAWAKLHTFLPS
jgi:hypothetical protein